MTKISLTVDGAQVSDEVKPRICWSSTCGKLGRPAPSAATRASAARARST